MTIRHRVPAYSLYGLLAANLAVTLAFWWNGSGALITESGPGSIAIAFGRLFGLLGELAILLQLLLIGRIRWIERFFGFDELNRLHRLIGYSIGIFFLGHPLLLIYGFAAVTGMTFVAQFMDILVYMEDVWHAAVAFVLFALVIVMSLPTIRHRVRYETWYFTHLLVYVGIIAVFGHQTKSGDFPGQPLFFLYWYALFFGVLGLLTLYRFVRPLYLFWRHRFIVDRVVQEASDVYSIYIKGRDIAHFGFRSGQFANLNFLTPGLWITHPFSFSQAPNGKYIRFSIKSLGDYTGKIATLKPGVPVIIDGPLGAFTEDEASRDKFLLIAGGIGITPIRALAESLATHQKNAMLLYGNRNEGELVFRDELDAIAHQHPSFRYHTTLSDLPERTPGDTERGRIDGTKIAALAPDFREREIYLCGPTPMMYSIFRDLRRFGVPKSQVHFEKFSY